MVGAGAGASVGVPNAWPRIKTNGLDFDDIFYLHPSDTTGIYLITMKLSGSDNYQTWIRAISDDLLVKNKLCFVDGTCVRESVT